MCARYSECCAVLLPYDQKTYHYRGSAALMEAAYFGRPAITLAGTAFADQATYYNLGIVCQNLEQMVSAVIKLSRENRSVLEQQASQSRYRFRADIEHSYHRWMGARS